MRGSRRMPWTACSGRLGFAFTGFSLQLCHGSALGEYRKAEREFDAALRLDSVNPEALVGKAGILLRKKQPEKALKLLSQVS